MHKIINKQTATFFLYLFFKIIIIVGHVIEVLLNILQQTAANATDVKE